ncbi:DUF6035 family protein [Photorhabdus bodei]|uniref:DUF6035 family protein n=1 Tax=Photorhabdus bodei TaxID=2029681 RepID=UPI0032B7B093
MSLVTRNMASVFLTEEDRNIDANEFLDNCDDERFFTYRRKLEEARKTNPIALCSVCFQPVVLRGNTHRTKFFAHTKNSEDCPIKTTTHLTQEEILAMKYNGQKEGRAHRDNKLKIAELLTLDKLFSDKVQVQPTFREKNNVGIAKRWRRPDISAVFSDGNYKIVFELQVSTTFLDVIINREKFYQENDTYIVWVFLSFDCEKFTTLDIAYANHANIFVFDREAQSESEQAEKLILKCHYRKPYMTENLTVDYKWTSVLVDFNDILLDKVNKKVYCADTTDLKQQVLEEIVNEKQRLERTKTEREQREAAERVIRKQEEQGHFEKRYKHSASSSSGYRDKRHRTIGATSTHVKSKSFGDAIRCIRCGNISKQKKVGSFLLCNKCFQPID